MLHDGVAQGEPRKAKCRYKVTGDSMDHAHSSLRLARPLIFMLIANQQTNAYQAKWGNNARHARKKSFSRSKKYIKYILLHAAVTLTF